MRPNGPGGASLASRGVAGCRGLVRRIFNAVQCRRSRKAEREAAQSLGVSGEKLTDEMERRMMEDLTRNRSFRP